MSENATTPVDSAALAQRAVAGAPARKAYRVVREPCERMRVGPPSITKFFAGISGTIAGFVGIACLANPLRPAPFALFALFAAFPALVVARARWQAGGELTADRLELLLRRQGRGRRIGVEQIEDGFAANGRLGLHLRGGAVIEATMEPQAARAVIEALGLTLDRGAQSAPLRGVIGGFTRGFLVGLLTWIAATVAVAVLGLPQVATLLAPLVGLGTGFAVARWHRPRVVVGSDGLRVAGTLRPRFIPYRRIRGVDRRSQAVGQDLHELLVVDTTKGELRLPVIGQSAEQIAALAARIEEARAAYFDRSARDIAILDRGERSVAAWSREVREAIGGGGGFRDAALSRVDLERVLADPGAPLERRIGAALALATDPKGCELVRLAAEQAADPVARGALDAVTKATKDGALDEDGVEAALRAIH